MKQYIGLAVGLAMTSGIAMAASDTPTFNSLDANQDGYVSKSEAKKDKEVVSNWKAIDVNKDGKIDHAEFSAFETTKMPMRGSQPASGADKYK
ncbi:MAG: hypothetical protein P8X94_13180 [Woeseiaceae bacterium]